MANNRHSRGIKLANTKNTGNKYPLITRSKTGKLCAVRMMTAKIAPLTMSENRDTMSELKHFFSDCTLSCKGTVKANSCNSDKI